MDGHDFIKLAGKLAAAPNADQATYRTAVSRACYGAFHLAKALLEELGFPPPANVNVHGAPRSSRFGQRRRLSSGQPPRRSSGCRNKADYQLNDPDVGSHAYAVTVVEKAHDIQSALAACSQAEAADTLKAAIGDYVKKISPDS